MVRAELIYACVAQLDLAAQQLQSPEPSYGRLALVLTDNVVELTLHRQCEEHFWLRGFLDPLLSTEEVKTRDRVLGKRFDEKPKFCCLLDMISELERDFILAAHRYRSEAYHLGVLHEDIVHALAWEYHALACQLFGRFPPRGVTVRFDDRPTQAVRRHFGEKGIDFVTNASRAFQEAAASLSQARPALDEELPVVLSGSAVRRIRKVQDDLAFLTTSNSDALDEGGIIERLQFYKHVFGEHVGIAGLTDIKEPPDLAAKLQEVRAAWRPKIRANPCPKWQERALALARETSPTVALRKFESLQSQTAEFVDIVSEAAASLSYGIELAGDLRRDMGL